MTKNQDAIRIIKTAIAEVEWEYPMDYAAAFDKAIEALEQEPCEDAIDRKLVCAFIEGLISDDREREKGLDYIRHMPPVIPQLRM